jgi:tRNA nucleotidyltransferase (CCA-adding enzyme)
MFFYNLILSQTINLVNNFKHLIYLKIADRLDHINLDSIDYFKYMDIAYDILSKNDCLAIKDLKINGNDLISLGYSGKKIGIILEDVLDNILNYNLDNNYDDIIKFVKNKF